MTKNKKNTIIKALSLVGVFLLIWNHFCWAYPFKAWTLRPMSTAKSRPDLDPSDKILLEPQPLIKKTADYIAPVDILEDEKAVGKAVADRIIEVAKEAPDAVIVLSVDSTVGLVCDALVERFKEAKDDERVDFSRIKFFVLSAYIGLTRDHPLSQTFFLRKALYERLRAIDPARAPRIENIHIPFLQKHEEPKQVAERYKQALQMALKRTGRGRIDLVVSGIGSAYPEYARRYKFLGLRGGSLGLNQPGSLPTDTTRAIKLESHTLLDIRFHIKNLKLQPGLRRDYSYKVPTEGISIGIAEILESNEILLLAVGEKSAPVIKKLYEDEPTPDFPVTFLKYHKSARWVLDKGAGYYLPHVWEPWKVREVGFEWTKKAVVQATFVALTYNRDLTIDELTAAHLQDIGVPENVIYRFAFENLRGIKAIRGYIRNSLGSCLHSQGNDLLPKEEDKFILFSPQPGDDVITMAAIIRMLAARGCKVTIAYLTSGEDAVRDGYPVTAKIYRHLVEEFLDREKGPLQSDKNLDLKERARARTRTGEAQKALIKLLGQEAMENVTQEFLNLAYYRHIGFVGVKPINKEDVEAVRQVLDKVDPDYIFFSAEEDPHGTHGLGTEIMARALRQRLLGRAAGVSGAKAPKLCGFRGAWQEWPLYQPEDLLMVPFDEELMRLKQAAIREHISQDFPMFPGPDSRPFWQRAAERNRQTGRALEQAGILEEPGYPSGEIWHAEAFRIFPYKEFLTGLEDNGVIAVTEDGTSYRLAERPDGSFAEEFRFGPGVDESSQEAAKEAIFKQVITHPNPEITRLVLEYSKEQIARYLAGLAVSCEESRDYRKAAEYWANALHRYLKEGQREQAIECRGCAVKNLHSLIQRFREPLSSVKSAESTKKNAELSEALGEEYKDLASRRWALASKTYNDLTERAKLREEKIYFHQESAKCAENAARLDKELAEKEEDRERKLERKRHQAKNMHFAALRWLLAKRYNKALGCAREAFQLEHDLGDKIFESMDLSMAASICFSLGRLTEAIKYDLWSIRLNKRLSKDPKLDWKRRSERKIHLVMDLGLVANCYFKIGRFNRAIKHGKDALDFMKTEGLERKLVGLDKILSIYRTLTYANYYESNYAEAAGYAAIEAEIFLKEKNNPQSAAKFLSLEGRNRYLLKEYDKALGCYESAAILREGVGENKNTSRDWAMAALIRIILAESGINKLENYKKAGYADRRSAELSEAEGDIEDALRHYLFAERNFDMALLPEGKEHCEEKAKGILRGVINEIWKKEIGVVTFKDLLNGLEKRYPRIFSIEIRKYTEDAVRKAAHRMREKAGSRTRPLSAADIIQDRKIASAA